MSAQNTLFPQSNTRGRMFTKKIKQLNVTKGGWVWMFHCFAFWF